MDDQDIKKRQKTTIGAQYPLNRFAEKRDSQTSEQAASPDKKKKPLVQETSEESFPASDPPAWAGNR